MKKKRIEIAVSLEAINITSACADSMHHSYPSPSTCAVRDDDFAAT